MVVSLVLASALLAASDGKLVQLHRPAHSGLYPGFHFVPIPCSGREKHVKSKGWSQGCDTVGIVAQVIRGLAVCEWCSHAFCTFAKLRLLPICLACSDSLCRDGACACPESVCEGCRPCMTVSGPRFTHPDMKYREGLLATVLRFCLVCATNKTLFDVSWMD